MASPSRLHAAPPSVPSNLEGEIDYESLPAASMGVSALAGGLAGITEHALMFPVDAIKTRMQMIAATPASSALYSGSLGTAWRGVASTEGIASLWRGVSSVVVGAGPAHALHFTTYEYMKKATGAEHAEGLRSVAGTAVSGGLATMANDGLMNPFDVVKQRMQMHGSMHTSVAQCARDILAREGIGAFYVSYPTTIMMTIPFQSLQFVVYEQVRALLNREGHYNPLVHCVAGAAAGAVAAAVTTPLDVCKTLLQTRGSTHDAEVRAAGGMRDAVRLIWRRFGVRGLTRGISARIVSHMPSTAICWTTYEFMKMSLSAAGVGHAPHATPASLSSTATAAPTPSLSSVHASRQSSHGSASGAVRAVKEAAGIASASAPLVGDAESRRMAHLSS
ncbi:hypothetical protein CXG81DRAFT_10274 [Caulochytrium protostelioides]|uniref:Mitochondrial carrier n=1 Tax=Caulochytrium protostelioides TaxID=1555241 RepID=A0A4V1IV53_9FUNG|nr:hypothetical protein CXG81DRAFT_10274 [Caulochytrium protostelioides]|eukprot:RKP02859.1 hypothetical protein CXG81DRAFT_10274 [Caulochytrium protostelioides]